jgi:beta-glucosidase
VDGAEVVQLYIADPIASIDRPSKELKGFEKVWLKAGEKKTVTFEIDADDLSFYDVTKGGWNAEAGEFLALIARSAGDVRETVMFNLK